jgi:hypothetical protein
MSLYHRIQRVKENPDTERAGAYWSPEEDIKLLKNIEENKALSEIALDHKRTNGSIEIRIRSLAYSEYKKIKESNISKQEIIEEISKKLRIPSDELTIYIRDKEKYNKEKDEKIIEKNKKIEELRLQKEKEKQELKEREKIKKQEEKEAKEREKQEEKEAKEREKREEKNFLDEEVYNYIYCIKEREFIKSGSNLVKVGRTNVHPFKRMKQYPNGSSIILILKVENCILAEKELLKYLDERFKSGTIDGIKIGREYYEATEQEIIQAIYDCLINVK